MISHKGKEDHGKMEIYGKSWLSDDALRSLKKKKKQLQQKVCSFNIPFA